MHVKIDSDIVPQYSIQLSRIETLSPVMQRKGGQDATDRAECGSADRQGR
jgi:hypothetical protein